MRHEYRCCSDRTVKHLNKSLLGAYIQIFQSLHPFFFHVTDFFSYKNAVPAIRNVHCNRCLLMCSVRIQKCSGQIHNLFSSPGQNQSRFFSYYCNLCCLQVLFCCISHEFFYVLWIYNNSHTLLRFGDCNLRSVKTCIFLRHFIKVYSESVCQFTNCDRYTTCTKVVTFFDQLTYFFSAEQTLNLTFCRRISLLDLCSTGLDRFLCVYFGRTGSSATAVTAGTAAKQNNDISRIRCFTDHCASRRCSQNGANLHTLCYIIRMINLLNCSGCETDLVTIRAVSMCSFPNKLLLRKLSFHCIFYRYSRICSTGYTHCLIYISTS